MKQKRYYMAPEVAVEQWFGKECWLFANISDGKDPTSAPRPRRDPAF